MDPQWRIDGWTYQTFQLKCSVRSRDGQVIADDPDASPQFFTWGYRKCWVNGEMHLFDGDLEVKIKTIFKRIVIREFERIAYFGN